MENLGRFQYTSRMHDLFLLLWRMTARIGMLYSSEVKDVYLDIKEQKRLRVELVEGDHPPKVVQNILD